MINREKREVYWSLYQNVDVRFHVPRSSVDRYDILCPNYMYYDLLQCNVMQYS